MRIKRDFSKNFHEIAAHVGPYLQSRQCQTKQVRHEIIFKTAIQIYSGKNFFPKIWKSSLDNILNAL